METLPKYINPKGTDYRAYHDEVRQYNISFQRRISDLMKENTKFNKIYARIK